MGEHAPESSFFPVVSEARVEEAPPLSAGCLLPYSVCLPASTLPVNGHGQTTSWFWTELIFIEVLALCHP